MGRSFLPDRDTRWRQLARAHERRHAARGGFEFHTDGKSSEDSSDASVVDTTA
jgi:hypothetical protein